MARYIDGHKPTRANPVEDTVFSLALIGVVGYFGYEMLKKSNPLGGFRWPWEPAPPVPTDPNAPIRSDCVVPYESAYWSDAIKRCLRANSQFWCLTESWVRREMDAGWFGSADVAAARSWPLFRQWVVNTAHPILDLFGNYPDPGEYPPAEWARYTLEQTGYVYNGGGGGAGGGGS